MSVQGHEAGKKRGEAKSVGEQMNWAGIITGHAPLGPERAGRLPVRELIRLLSKLHQISPKLLPRRPALPSIRCRRLPRFSAPQKNNHVTAAHIPAAAPGRGLPHGVKTRFVAQTTACSGHGRRESASKSARRR